MAMKPVVSGAQEETAPQLLPKAIGQIDEK
jgi:hypothetical protein